MKKSRFSEEQIIAVLREQDGAMKTADVCRKRDQQRDAVGLKAKYGGMDVSQARKLKVLEDENARLKRLLLTRGSTTPCSRRLPQKTGRACRSAEGC
ncbi:putative transposase [Sphingomonas sp. BK069]|nr:putative transposase [Sphingomonas sp. BK069]